MWLSNSSEAVSQTCSEKMFFKFLQNSQKHLRRGVSRPAAYNFIKKDSITGVFLSISQSFLEHLFHRATASDSWFTIHSKKLNLMIFFLNEYLGLNRVDVKKEWNKMNSAWNFYSDNICFSLFDYECQ